MERLEVPKDILRSRSKWNVLQRWWWALHYGLGIGGLAAGSSAALGWRPETAGAVAAACAGLSTFLGAAMRGYRYKLAYQTINLAVVDAELGNLGAQDLSKAFAEAQFLALGTEPKIER